MTQNLVHSTSTAFDPITLIAATHLRDSNHSPTVLHVINGEHFSGAERVQQLLGKRLADFGYRAHFACVEPGKFLDHSGLAASQVSLTPMKGRFDFGVLKQLTKVIERESIEILHAHTPRTAMITSLLAFKHRLPWVYHVHSPTLRDSSRGMVNRVNGLIERFSIRNCNCLITVSHSLAAEMRRLGVQDHRLVTVANGVPDIDPIDTSSRVNRKAWRLGMIALMRPRKGVEIALQAMQRIIATNQDVSLELIGGFETPEYQKHILAMILELGVQDHVHWLGFTNNVPDAIRQLDALLLPSLYGEGMPMVVLEALAAAVPVVATSVEGTPEVIREGIEGLLAKPGCAESLAKKIEQMTGNRLDWSLMSSNALKRHREHFSDRQMAQGVAQAYNQLRSPCNV